ncbi:MAG: peptidylprolyl isomerase [Pseudomonadota bacterium]
MAPIKKIALLLLLSIIAPVGIATAGDNKGLDNKTFAIVNGEPISATSFLSALNSGMRQRFYHGNIPAAQLAAFRKETAEKLVDNALLLSEARRRNIEPAHKAVQQQLDGYERRYADSAQWQARREKLLPGLRAQLESQSLLKRITAELKKQEMPNEAAVLRYYQDNPDKFTTPQRNKVSLILLKVDPSSPKDVWDSARSEAAALIKKIKAGESFAELAKIHSTDTQSAASGGDMGYLHQGMLAEEAETVLTQLNVGELSEPVTTLQGVVILRLDDISSSKLNEFQKVRERATALLHRELSEQHYQQSLQRLRSSASIQVNTALVEPQQK